MARLSFRCDEELVARVDKARGMIPREPWLRRAVERALIVSAVDAIADERFQSQPGPIVENIRSSSQSKRDVSPRPKGGKT